MNPKLVENISLNELTAEIWLPGETIILNVSGWDKESRLQFAREAMASKTPGSPFELAAQYMMARFNARLIIHPSDEAAGATMLNSSILAVDARQSGDDAAAHDKNKIPRVAACAASLLQDAGLWAEPAKQHGQSPAKLRGSARAALAELAAMTKIEAMEAEERRSIIHVIFEPSSFMSIQSHGVDKRLASQVASWPEGARHVDYACRGPSANPHQWIADLIARAMLTRYSWGEDVFDKWDNPKSEPDASSHERPNALAMALAAVEALPAMESLPKFDGMEPFPEREYSASFCNNKWKKPEMEGLDILDALLSEELAGRGGQQADAGGLARLILGVLREAIIEPGRSAKLLPLVLGGVGGQGDARFSRPNKFSATQAASIAQAIAKSDPSFDLHAIQWSKEAAKSDAGLEILKKSMPRAWSMLLACEALPIERAAGPSTAPSKKGPRI